MSKPTTIPAVLREGASPTDAYFLATDRTLSFVPGVPQDLLPVEAEGLDGHPDFIIPAPAADTQETKK